MRWLSRDPIEEAGGINLYASCENSIMGVDVLGFYFDGIANFITEIGNNISLMKNVGIEMFIGYKFATETFDVTLSLISLFESPNNEEITIVEDVEYEK